MPQIWIFAKMDFGYKQLQEVLRHVPDLHLIITESGRYVAVFGMADHPFHHDCNHLIGKFLHDVFSKEKADILLAHITHALREQSLCIVQYTLSVSDVLGLDNNNGPAGTLHFEGRIQPLTSLFRGERAVIWVARDVNQRHKLEAQLRRMSETDELTGLFNRRKLFSQLSVRFHESQCYGYPVALLMLDIDHFKHINDHFGHMIGDEVLRCIARVCDDQLRDSDLLIRFGGEEFAVLLPNTDMEPARTIAERLRLVVARTVCCRAPDDIMVTISIGGSAVQPGDSGPDEVLRRADDALYEAKRGGRNQVIVYLNQ